jgi:hypothetical protein
MNSNAYFVGLTILVKISCLNNNEKNLSILRELDLTILFQWRAKPNPKKEAKAQQAQEKIEKTGKKNGLRDTLSTYQRHNRPISFSGVTRPICYSIVQCWKVLKVESEVRHGRGKLDISGWHNGEGKIFFSGLN